MTKRSPGQKDIQHPVADEANALAPRATKRARQVSYTVGYGRPPISTQFQREQSGNPNGRPKKTTRPKSSMARAALERKVCLFEAGSNRKASVRQVAYERIGEKALAGDIRSVNFLLARENDEQPPVPDQLPVPPETALEILREYFARERAKKGNKK
jgi:Family of unknown function (DUF5681)